MPDNVLVFYGSYRSTRIGIRMATFVIEELRACGALPKLIDAREIGLPIIDRMYKDYSTGSAPWAMEDLARKIRAADAFVFVVGEYNWGPQPGLKNLTDHFLEEWFWRPAAIARDNERPRRRRWSGLASPGWRERDSLPTASGACREV
jgi:NAD(P)H-dependent FMN reductase